MAVQIARRFLTSYFALRSFEKKPLVKIFENVAIKWSRQCERVLESNYQKKFINCSRNYSQIQHLPLSFSPSFLFFLENRCPKRNHRRKVNNDHEHNKEEARRVDVHRDEERRERSLIRNRGPPHARDRPHFSFSLCPDTLVYHRREAFSLLVFSLFVYPSIYPSIRLVFPSFAGSFSLSSRFLFLFFLFFFFYFPTVARTTKPSGSDCVEPRSPLLVRSDYDDPSTTVSSFSFDLWITDNRIRSTCFVLPPHPPLFSRRPIATNLRPTEENLFSFSFYFFFFFFYEDTSTIIDASPTGFLSLVSF